MFFQFRDNILSNAVSAELVIAIDPNDIVFGLLFYADATFEQNLCEFRERIPFLTQSPVLLVEFSLLPCCELSAAIPIGGHMRRKTEAVTFRADRLFPFIV
jgi:hypothetical protein